MCYPVRGNSPILTGGLSASRIARRPDPRLRDLSGADATAPVVFIEIVQSVYSARGEVNC